MDKNFILPKHTDIFDHLSKFISSLYSYEFLKRLDIALIKPYIEDDKLVICFYLSRPGLLIGYKGYLISLVTAYFTFLYKVDVKILVEESYNYYYE